jgi:hypothetical protein
MRFLIPIVAGLLFRAGGMDQWKWCPLNQKLWRWLMGVVLGLMLWKGWVLYGLCIVSYLLATNLFGYGDKSPILKYLPQNIKHLVSGMIFGLASFPLIGYWCILQIIISGINFYYIEVRKVNNPWAELLRGAVGTLVV